MGYADGWYIDKRVALQRLYGIVTIEDAELSRDGITRLLEQGTPLVHVMVDVTDIEKFPTNLAALKRLIPDVDNPKLGWLIIYGANNVFIRFLASTLSQVALPGVRMRMFSTLDESLTFLQEQDSTLGNLMSFGDTA